MDSVRQPRYNINLCFIYFSFQNFISEIQLGDNDKPLQLMSTWPSLMTRYVTKTTAAEIPKLCLRRNVFISPAKEKSVGKRFYKSF